MSSNKIIIIDKDELLSKELTAEVMNHYFVDISKNLIMKDNTDSNIRHLLKNVLFENHVSFKMIGKKNTDNGEFRFHPI